MCDKKIIAMIPARLGSKRIPKKNIRYMIDKPLIKYPIDLVLQNECFDEVWVNTESKLLGEYCEKIGAKFHKRPDELATDTATNRDFVYEFLCKHECDYVVMINPTSPALRKETIDRFIGYIMENDYDTILSVNSFKAEGFYQNKEINFSVNETKINSQFLNPIQIVIWALTAWKRETFLNLENSGKSPVFGGNIGLFEIPKDESPDLDTEEDWRIAEGILLSRSKEIDKKYLDLL